MVPSRDPRRVARKVGVYISLYVATVFVVGPVLGWFGALVGVTATGFAAACVANALTMRIYQRLSLLDIGLRWNRSSAVNLGLGLAGGMGAACLVLVPPLVLHAAHLSAAPPENQSLGTFFFLPLLLLLGAAGEEMLFRGYGFQVLLRAAGAYATIIPIGVVFALLHAANPNASYIGLANTAGFGILFGYAFLRSRDLWLPIGLHYGWNLALPLFGVNVSGITMRLTGYTMEWTAGPLWSGGEYGPEASVLTSIVFAVLFLFLWKGPICQQTTPLLGPPREN